MQSGTYGDQPVCDQVSALYPCDRRFISAAITAGVVTPPASCNSANSSRVTWAHALRMQPLSTQLTSKLRSYRRTTQPSSGPSGSRKSCFLWMAILFCTAAVAVAQFLASSALISRFKRCILGLLRRAAFVAGFAARTSLQHFMSQPQHQHLSRPGQGRCLIDTPCT